MVSYLGFFIGLFVGIAFCVGIPNLAPGLRKLVDDFRKYRSKSTEKEKKEYVNKIGDVSLGGKKVEYY